MATKRDFVISYGLQADKSSGSSDTLFVDYLNDKVGVGSTQPSEKLHVEGNLHVTGNVTVDGTYPGGGGGGSSISLGNTSISIADTGSNGTITFATEGSTAMTLTSSQKLGIGVLEPFQKLEVDGSIVATNSLYLGSILDFSVQNNLLQLTNSVQTDFNINVPELRLSIYGVGQRAKLTSTGFGIVGGTVSEITPAVPLEIYSNNGTFVRIRSQYPSAQTDIGDNFIKFNYAGGSTIDSVSSLLFRNPSDFTTALKIDTADKIVLINNEVPTSNVNEKLQVTGDAYVSGSVTAAGQSSKLRFYFAALADLPSATDWHGMFAHVHATGKAYYAHGGNWVELANNSDIPAAYSLPTATVGTSTTGTLGGVKVDGSTITITDGVISATGGGGGSSNSFATIAVSGQSDVVADSSTDTLTLVAGSGITLTTNATSDSITITSTGGGGGISNVVEDTTPELGGPLDLNSKRIIHDGSGLGGTDGDISFIPTNAVFNTTAGGMVISVRNTNSTTWSTHTILGPDVTIDGSVTANSFVKSGGTSSQYLMADGSVTTSAGGGGGGISESLAIAYAIAL